MQRAIANSSRTIRMPVHLGQRERKLGRAQAKLAARLGRSPTDDELAEEVVIDLRRAALERSAKRPDSSIVPWVVR